jgi:hypothetical protein
LSLEPNRHVRDKAAASGVCREANRRESGKSDYQIDSICIFDGVFASDFGDDNMHPSLIAFLNVIQIPVWPVPALGLGGGDR